MKDIKKLIEIGNEAIKRNPQLRLTKEELKAVIKANEGNFFRAIFDVYSMGFTLGFALGKRHERGDLPK